MCGGKELEELFIFWHCVLCWPGSDDGCEVVVAARDGPLCDCNNIGVKEEDEVSVRAV